ncbi:MAG TPA: hypothetical protein DCG65_04950 [Hyphomonas atlantica]|uniref:Uncharacterized protein n=1 Tax=Hyphomonas atlantica TaxID=1280948 RepID=A0A3B9KZX9_9PROT|nr:hypothetical protein [Hyphomonas atlantica]HAE93885.1 hypothetical protein [Hyphomonas atlantica]|tara:strand:+ start:332 stop:583 length:252 start_codon:yes stop_codon:yes gene_type:complete
MGMVERQRAKRMKSRIDNPHEWAEEIERRVDQRLLFPSIAALCGMAALAGCYVVWQKVNSLEHRIEQLERVSDLPPPGFTVVE